ncbi:MAG: MFS transporter [Chitinophagaceae bacterium]|nr:MFS transporter [Rubrivivax sp.]
MKAVPIFLAFGFAYFFSALLRGVTATLAPVFSAELGLRAAELGLLAGAYFFGFAALQLPLGRALDKHGPRRTLIALLALAVLGCAGFAMAPGLPEMIAARVCIGAGVAACLMAPLTSYRRLFSAGAQLRANSWMLMTGSLGMLASTLPVQWLMPHWGWRGLFWAVAGSLALAMLLLAWCVPADKVQPDSPTAAADIGYGAIVRHPLFTRLAPLGFFLYGGLIAVQSLWAGPWLTHVGGASAEHAARGLFFINLCMLLTFMTWGALMPRLHKHGIDAMRLIAWGVPLALLMLVVNVWRGAQAGVGSWALWCVLCTFVSVAQPAVGQVFPASQAGRALSAFNLVIFGGVFCVQWGIGLLVDAFRAAGLADADAFRSSFAAFGGCCLVSYLWFLRRRRQPADNPVTAPWLQS